MIVLTAPEHQALVRMLERHGKGWLLEWIGFVGMTLELARADGMDDAETAEWMVGSLFDSCYHQDRDQFYAIRAVVRGLVAWSAETEPDEVEANERC